MGLTLSRAVFVTIGGGILLMALSGLASGNSLTDPVFPLGLALGTVMVGAGIWATSAGALPTLIVWLAVLGVAATIVVGGVLVATGGPHGADVWVLYLVPSALMALVAARIAIGRLSPTSSAIGPGSSDGS